VKRCRSMSRAHLSRALANQRRRLRARLGQHSFLERQKFRAQQGTSRLPVRLPTLLRRARVEVVGLVPRDYRVRPDSLPAADSERPVVAAAVAEVDFRADSARTKLARRQ
jgi:hypothetical protein